MQLKMLLCPLQRFLQCQLKNKINAYGPALGFIVYVFITWLFVGKLKYGLLGIALTINFSWWVTVLVMFTYVACGGCPDSWKGFYFEAFNGLWEFIKLSAVSGVILWFKLTLETWNAAYGFESKPKNLGFQDSMKFLRFHYIIS